MVWAFIIGNVCSTLAMLDVEVLEHKQLMDQVNNFVVQHNVPHELTTKLRRYFIKRAALNRSAREHELILMLSPMLRARAAESRCEWLFNVVYLRNASVQLVVLLEAQLDGQVYPPEEKIHWQDSLCNLGSGTAARGGRILAAGASWGLDFILEDVDLKDRSPVHTLTYVEVLNLSRDSFYDVLEHFPEERAHVKKRTLLIAITAIVRVQKALAEKDKEDPATYIKRAFMKLGSSSRDFSRSVSGLVAANAALNQASDDDDGAIPVASAPTLDGQDIATVVSAITASVLEKMRADGGHRRIDARRGSDARIDTRRGSGTATTLHGGRPLGLKAESFSG